MAAILTLGLAVVMPSAAHAAPNQVQIDDVFFVNENGSPTTEFEDGSRQKLEVDMSIPGNATIPVSGTIFLDDRLKGDDARIVIKSPDGEDIGLCSVYADRVECSLEDWYVEQNPENMTGSIEFWVWIAAGNTETEDIDFEVGGTTTETVTVTPRPDAGQCETDCEFDGTDGFKYGTYKPHEGVIEWWIRVPAGEDGLPVGVPVVVEEQWDDSLFRNTAGSPFVTYFDSVIVSDEGYEQLTYPNRLPADQFTVSEDGKTVSFVTSAGKGPDADLPPGERGLTGRVYDVVWTVDVLDGGSSALYENSVKITIGGPDDEKEYELEGQAEGQGGSGSAVGQNQGRISLEKLVTGSASGRNDLPSAYTVTYTACDTQKNYDPTTHTGDDCIDGSAELRPGAKTWLPAFSAGTRVVGTEVTPTEPAGVEWDGQFQLVDASGTPISGSNPDAVFDVTFSADNGNLGKMTYFQVTNEATDTTPVLAPFQVRKSIINNDGVDLSGVTEYTLEYTYPAGENFPAGSGSVTLPASGKTVTGPAVPIGAVLTFTEVPPAVAHATWQPVQITPNPLTITGDANQAEVEVTNQIELNTGRFTAVKKIETDDGIDPSDLPEVDLDYWFMDNGTRVEGTLRLQPGGPAVVSPELPIGSEVHFEEGAWSAPGIDWGTPTISPNPLVITDNPADEMLVTVTNPVDLANGHFLVRKVVTGLDGTGVSPSELPEFVVTYTWAHGLQSGGGTLLVKDGESEISDTVPLGAVVHITEANPVDPPEGYDWGTPVISPNDFTMAYGVDVEVTVENPLVQTAAPFHVTKAIDDVNATGGDFSGLPAFSVDYAWTLGQDSGNGTIDVKNGETASSGLIPLGAEVTVSEATPTFTAPGYEWGTPVIDPETFTMETGKTVEVSVTNPASLLSGDFTARKVINNPEGMDVSDTPEFWLLYEWSPVGNLPGGTELLRLDADGTPATSGKIPYGAQVTVYELPPAAPEGGDWADPSLNGEEIYQFTMSPDANAQVEVVATNTIQRLDTRFWAQKELVNDENVDLSGITDYVLEYTYVFPWVPDTAPAEDRGGSATLSLPADGRTMQSISLPHGTEVTVSEATPVEIPGSTWETPKVTPESFTLNAAAEQTLMVNAKNEITRDRGTFSANKVVTNDENLDISGITGYELFYTYTYPWVAEDAPITERGGTGSLMLPADGETVRSVELPNGTEVTVEEVNVVTVSGATWADPELSVRDFTIDTTAEETVHVTLTNVITRDSGLFNAKKKIVNEQNVDLSKITGYVLQYTYEFPWVSEDTPASERGGIGALQMPANGELSPDSMALPHGTEVTVSEVLPVLPAGAEWSTPQFSVETFVIDAAQSEPLTVEVVNTVKDTRKPLSKTGSDGVPALLWGAALVLLAAGVTLTVRGRRVS